MGWDVPRYIMWKKGTLNLFERDYKESTGLKRGKNVHKRKRLAQDLKKIRKGKGGKAHGGRHPGVRSRVLDRMANTSELSRDIKRGKYAKTRSSKGGRAAGDVGYKTGEDMHTTKLTSHLAGKAEISARRAESAKKKNK